MTLKFLYTDKPNGKFVAFYGDGSGAAVFMTHDAGYLTAEGEDVSHDDLMGQGFCQWQPLPDNFELWFESREEDRSL